MKKKKSLGSVVLGLLVAAVVWFLQEKGYLAKEEQTSGGKAEKGSWQKKLSQDQKRSGNSGGSAIVPTGEVSFGDFTPVQTFGRGWTHLKNCRFITGRNSDGDSFHVKHEEGETEFRLYFVDTPESQYKTYRGGENNGERIAEQGDYFGGLSQDATTTVGRASKEVVKRLLSKNDFQVLTKWEDVYGPDRKYCLVIVPWEGKQVYLHELLVAKGVARIHTRGADLPQGREYREQKSFLKGMERTARDKKLGAWGL